MILVSTPDEARLPGPQAGWIYLGKDPRARAALKARLDQKARPLGSLLHEEAKRLRQPFLDWVASLGRTQDPWSWWSGTLAWKDPSASDLFLLACYESLCLRLCQSPKLLGLGSLVVVVEDPWLFLQLKQSLAGREGVRFSGNTNLALSRLKALALGVARRLKWLCRIALSRLRQARHSRGRRPDWAGSILLYSHLMPRSLEGNEGWRDHYLTGLAEELEAAGARVMRLTDPGVTGWERALAQRHKILAPPILFSSWKGLLKALAALPPGTPDLPIGGMPAGLLLQREWWHDLSRAGRCDYLFMADCCRRLFKSAPFKALVYPWENQPQERMLLLAAREAGINAIGYQHSTVPSLQLSFFMGRGEEGWSPLPDLLLTSGPYPTRLLAENGFPQGRLRLGGSRRYGLKPARKGQASCPDVLVVLPIDEVQSRHMLSAIASAYPGGGTGFRFRVKPHPAQAFDPGWLGFPAEIERAPLEEALERAGLVIFCGSTAGLEALQRGLAVLRYRSETLVEVDPCEFLGEEELPSASDADLGERLASLKAAPGPGAGAWQEIFSPLDPHVWREAILDGKAEAPMAGASR